MNLTAEHPLTSKCAPLPDHGQIPVPDGFHSDVEIARYRAWLEGAYCAAISESVRRLIADVYDDLSAVPASGFDAGSEFGEVIRAAVQSVSTAIKCDAAARDTARTTV